MVYYVRIGFNNIFILDSGIRYRLYFNCIYKMDGLCFIFHSLAVSNLSAKEKSLESSLYATYITIYLCLIYKNKIEPNMSTKYYSYSRFNNCWTESQTVSAVLVYTCINYHYIYIYCPHEFIMSSTSPYAITGLHTIHLYFTRNI